MTKEENKEERENKESDAQKRARVLRDAYERLSAAGTPEADYELKELVDEAEKSAGVKFIETKTEPPRPKDYTWQGEPVPPFRQGDVTRFKEHPVHKTLAQIKEEKAYKDEHRGEISQQKYEEAVGKDYRGRVKSEAEEEDMEKEKKKNIAEQAKEGKAMEQQPEEVQKKAHPNIIRK
jgi:hypothetical protein